MSNRKDGTTVLNIGKSRSGKTSIIKAVEKLNNKIFAFDPKTEWVQLGFDKFEDKAILLRELKKIKCNDSFKIAFASYNKNDFDFWSSCAFNLNRKSEILIIAEELGSVVSVGKANGGWGRLINQGLGYGMTLQATVQRGQEVDKTIINNSTAINIFQHSTEQDAKNMSERIGVDISLIPREPMKFIVWSPVCGVIIKDGTVEYKNNAPVFKYKKNGVGRSKSLYLQRNGLFKDINYF